ncbi:hypothetical protein FHJ31_17410 [Pseudomonas sp. Fig-3]|nr:hypothetical protein FHJ31_17410 [Pseudomonas sp. Fig-3]
MAATNQIFAPPPMLDAGLFLPAANARWERACSRWRWVSQLKCQLIYRYSEQARSHRVICRFFQDLTQART